MKLAVLLFNTAIFCSVRTCAATYVLYYTGWESSEVPSWRTEPKSLSSTWNLELWNLELTGSAVLFGGDRVEEISSKAGSNVVEISKQFRVWSYEFRV